MSATKKGRFEMIELKRRIAGREVLVRTHDRADIDELTALFIVERFGTPEFLDTYCPDGILTLGIDGGTPEDWANESHLKAQTAWHLRPTDEVLDDRYYQDVLPILDRQLGVAGLRLAKFLNEAYATPGCSAPWPLVKLK